MRDDPPSAWGVFWRSSLVGWLLLASLVLNALAMEPRTSEVGSAIRACLGPTYPGRTSPLRVLVWRDEAGVVRAGDRLEVAASLVELPVELRQAAGEYWLWWPRPRPALWTPIVERLHFRLVPKTLIGGSTTPDPAYRAAAYDYLAATYPGLLPPGLRTADVTVSTFKPGGLIANLLALASAAGLGVRVIQRIRSGRGRSLAQARLAKGLCPHCACAMSGHESPICPECGGSLPR